jgi:hypothetical protein
LEGDLDGATLWKQRLDNQQETQVDASVPWHATLNGAVAGWFTPDGKRINVYDAHAQRWILQGQTLAQLGITGDDQGQLFAFDDESAFFASSPSTQTPTTTFRYWTYEFGTKKLTELGALKDPGASAVADGQLYLAEFDTKHEGQRLFSMPLTGGARKDLGLLPHGLGARLVVEKGQVVLASYQDQADHTHEADPKATGGPSSPSPDQDPWSIPIPSVALAAIALAAFVSARRGRK